MIMQLGALTSIFASYRSRKSSPVSVLYPGIAYPMAFSRKNETTTHIYSYHLMNDNNFAPKDQLFNSRSTTSYFTWTHPVISTRHMLKTAQENEQRSAFLSDEVFLVEKLWRGSLHCRAVES